MKDENKVKEFMEEQRKLARRAARAIKVKRFSISYVEFLPSWNRYYDYEKEQYIETLEYPEQRQLSHSIIKKTSAKKQRIRVIIQFHGNIKEKYLEKLDKVMGRQYNVWKNQVIYGVNPFH